MTTTNPDKHALLAQVQGAYDLQKTRIGYGNRIVQTWYQAHGVAPSTKPSEELSPEDKSLLKKLQKDYAQLADAVVSQPRDPSGEDEEDAGIGRLPSERKFKPGTYIDSYALLSMVHTYNQVREAERTAFKGVERSVDKFPIRYTYLKGVTGCGPSMSAVIISHFDIYKAVYPSQFCAYAGLDVGPDGMGRSRRQEHLIDREYVNKKGEKQTRKSITFEPLVKTKLVGVLGPSFLKLSNPKYQPIYKHYKERLKHSEKYIAGDPERGRWKDTSDGHRHNAAIRYMLKIFLQDLWREWRILEGLPVVPPYHEAKLGIHHGHAA